MVVNETSPPRHDVQARIIRLGKARLAPLGEKKQMLRALFADAPVFLRYISITLAVRLRSYIPGAAARMRIAPFFAENHAIANLECSTSHLNPCQNQIPLIWP